LIYGFIVCIVGFSLVYLSISEMASMLVLLHPLALTQSLTPLNRAPTSGGRKLIILIARFCHAALDFFASCCLTLKSCNETKRKKRKENERFPYTSRLDIKPVSPLSKHMYLPITPDIHANREFKSIIGCRNSPHAAPRNTSATSLVTHPNHTRADGELTRFDQVISSRLGGSAPLHPQPFSPVQSSKVFWFLTTPPTSSSAGMEQCLS